MEVGYAGVSVNGKVRYAHHIACEHRNGPRPDGLHAAHECGNRGCVNPRHLSWKTISANQMDRVRHGTSNRGERSPVHKLTESEVWVIQGMFRFPNTDAGIAREFGVGTEAVRRIRIGTRWEWLTGNGGAIA